MFTAKLLNDLPITINGDGEQRRDFVYVGDVIDANIECMIKKNSSDSIFNIGDGANISVNELADELSKDAPRISNPPLVEARETLADIAKAKNLLNWSPKVRLGDWIESYKKDLGL